MTWEQIETLTREQMKAQPRGYAAELARRLEVDRSVVSQFMSGERPIPRDKIHIVLDTLGFTLTLQRKTADT